MKLAVIGLGSIGRRHLGNCAALRNELEIEEIRCFDANPQRTKEASASAENIVAAASLEEAVRGIDAAFVCVSTSAHIPVMAEMHRYGRCHLYLEKPLSHTLAGCDELLFSQQRAGKALVVGYMLPRHPVLRKVKELVAGGTLGRILSARVESGFYLPKWHPWEDYRDFYMSWKTGGGGALLDSSHEINYLQWILGEVTEVTGFLGHVSDLEITSDDLSLAILRFKNGAAAEVHLDLLQFDESRYCKLVGTEGVIIGDLTKNTVRYNLRENEAWQETTFEVNFDAIYHDQLRAFVKRCRGGESDLIEGNLALETMQVVEAVRRSHSYSSTVKLPLYD